MHISILLNIFFLLQNAASCIIIIIIICIIIRFINIYIEQYTQPGAWLHLYTVNQAQCAPQYAYHTLHLRRRRKNDMKKHSVDIFFGVIWHIILYAGVCYWELLVQLLLLLWLRLLHMVLGYSCSAILWVLEPIYWYTSSSSSSLSLSHSIANGFHCIVQSTQRRACICCYSDNSFIVFVGCSFWCFSSFYTSPSTHTHYTAT